jgi:hypothetical protein
MYHPPQNDDRKSQRRHQFRLLDLFICTTVFAISFAMIHWWGFNGFVAFSIAALYVLATIMGLDRSIKRNIWNE